MRVHQGQTRIVFEFERAGIVLKCPRIFFRTLRSPVRLLLRDPRAVWPILINKIRWYILGNFVVNLREWWFWVRERHPFCQPTPFSIPGVVNVQPSGTVLPYDEVEHARRLQQVTTDYHPSTMHTLLNPKNFCVVDGRLRIFDYGSPEVIEFIRRHGHEVHECYDVSVPNHRS